MTILKGFACAFRTALPTFACALATALNGTVCALTTAFPAFLMPFLILLPSRPGDFQGRNNSWSYALLRWDVGDGRDRLKKWARRIGHTVMNECAARAASVDAVRRKSGMCLPDAKLCTRVSARAFFGEMQRLQVLQPEPLQVHSLLEWRVPLRSGLEHRRHILFWLQHDIDHGTCVGRPLCWSRRSRLRHARKGEAAVGTAAPLSATAAAQRLPDGRWASAARRWRAWPLAPWGESSTVAASRCR